MKKGRLVKYLMLFCLPMTVLVCCSKKKTQSDNESMGLPASGGKTLEVVLVIPDDIYKGDIKDTIGKYFMKACKGLPQAEPLFDVVQMNPSGFFNSDMLKKHRNIIIIDHKAGNPNKLTKQINYKSYPQAYFQFSTSDRDSLYSLIARYSNTIREQFYLNEYKRVQTAFKKLENINITKTLKSKFGFYLTVSEEFYLATNDDDFVWLRKEPKDGSLGLMIYTMPYKGEQMFEQEYILSLRDSITKKHIPGPRRGSYMGVERRAEFVRDTTVIGNDIKAIETRGLWRLFNDFMGGPFVNYCFLDKKNNRFVMIDGFVYSPRNPKRDQLIQLEAVIRGIKEN